jgi:uncharacterized membrane-anchored protein
MKSALLIGALVIVTALSAYFDARGFVYAAQTWREGSLVPGVVFLALVNFMGGIALYIGSIGFQQRLGVESATMQTIFWFVMTVVGIAIMDGTIGQWSIAQRAVGVAVTAGIGWLMVSAAH